MSGQRMTQFHNLFAFQLRDLRILSGDLHQLRSLIVVNSAPQTRLPERRGGCGRRFVAHSSSGNYLPVTPAMHSALWFVMLVIRSTPSRLATKQRWR